MARFSSYLDYEQFHHWRRDTFRFERSPRFQAFLEAVSSTARKREIRFPVGTILYRAQSGYDEVGFVLSETKPDGTRVYQPKPFDASRMKPRLVGATEGRANVKGIPALYAATVAETALSEMRPSRGQILSLAKLKLNNTQRLVDMTLLGSPHSVHDIVRDPSLLKSNPPTQAEMEEIIWRNMDDAFAAPVERTDTTADYAATQNIAEVLKLAGYDGLVYRSYYGPAGKNVVLFDLDSAQVTDVTTRSVLDVTLKFST